MQLRADLGHDNSLRPRHLRSTATAPRVPLFVYGTLLPGAAAHARLRGARDLGAAHVAGRLYRCGRHPALKPARRAGERVQGRLYLVAHSALGVLDAYEDHQPRTPVRGEYRRVRLTAVRACGLRVTAWAYRYNRPCAARQRLPDGVWRTPGPAR